MIISYQICISGSHLRTLDLLEVFQLDHLEETLVVPLQLDVSFGSESLVEGRSSDGVDDSELRGALLQLQLQFREAVKLGQAQLASELLSEDQVVLELLQAGLDLGSRLLLLRRHLYLLTLPLVVVIVDLLLVLRLIPVVLLVLDGRLEIRVDLRLLHLRLALLDEERELVVEFVDEFEDVEELCTLGLDGTQFEGLLVLDHASLEVVELSVDDAHHLVDLGHLRRVLPVLFLPQLQCTFQDLQGLGQFALQLVEDADVVETVAGELPSNVGTFLEALDSLAEVSLLGEVAPHQEVAIGCLVGVSAEEGHDDLGVEDVVGDAVHADGVAEVGNAGNQVQLLLQVLVELLLHRLFLLQRRHLPQVLQQPRLLLQVLLQLLLPALLVAQQQVRLRQQAHRAPVVQFELCGWGGLKAFSLESDQDLGIKEAFRELLVAEIFIVAFANLVDLLLEVVGRGTDGLAVALVPLPPVLELVVTRTVEGTLALAALEQGLLAADLAAWRRTSNHLLYHSISTVISLHRKDCKKDQLKIGL